MCIVQSTRSHGMFLLSGVLAASWNVSTPGPYVLLRILRWIIQYTYVIRCTEIAMWRCAKCDIYLARCHAFAESSLDASDSSSYSTTDKLGDMLLPACCWCDTTWILNIQTRFPTIVTWVFATATKNSERS